MGTPIPQVDGDGRPFPAVTVDALRCVPLVQLSLIRKEGRDRTSPLLRALCVRHWVVRTHVPSDTGRGAASGHKLSCPEKRWDCSIPMLISGVIILTQHHSCLLQELTLHPLGTVLALSIPLTMSLFAGVAVIFGAASGWCSLDRPLDSNCGSC